MLNKIGSFLFFSSFRGRGKFNTEKYTVVETCNAVSGRHDDNDLNADYGSEEICETLS